MNSPPEPNGGSREEADRPVLESIRGLFRARDPMPAELGARVRFALDLAGLERELATTCADLQLVAASRGTQPARTFTFECGPLTVAIMITQAGDRRRLDGWVAPERPLMVELRQGTERLFTRSDPAGRFVFAGLVVGEAQLAIRPDPDGDSQSSQVMVQTIEL